MSADNHVHTFVGGGYNVKTCSSCGVGSDVECANGHLWTEDTTRFLPDGKRRCRACQRIKNRTRRSNLNAEQKATEAEIAKVRIGGWRSRMKRAIFEHYGLSCACCGESTYEFLCIDHVDGNGNAHRRELNGSDKVGSDVLYRWLNNQRPEYPEGFQTLCHNCNFAKHAHAVCPHQR